MRRFHNAGEDAHGSDDTSLIRLARESKAEFLSLVTQAAAAAKRIWKVNGTVATRRRKLLQSLTKMSLAHIIQREMRLRRSDDDVLVYSQSSDISDSPHLAGSQDRVGALDAANSPSAGDSNALAFVRAPLGSPDEPSSGQVVEAAHAPPS
eukprot:3789737-Pyramimonas_sp.AAC.1